MNKILDKRDSLERFIREQTLGPGINGYRFVDLEDENLLRTDLYSARPIDYATEILDIVPAAIYSTGILFPEDSTQTAHEGIILDNNETTESGFDEESDFQGNSSDDVESTNTIELNQMFPRTMGMTCCLDEKCLENNKIEIKVSARHYKKIKSDKEGKSYKRYGLLCEVDKSEILSFLTHYNLTNFQLREINDNTFIVLRKTTSEEITDLKIRIREVQKQKADIIYDKALILIALPTLSKNKCNLSNIKSTIYYELKNNIIDENKRSQLYLITQEIELIESITDHLRNILDANAGGYGLWQSEIIERTIQIEDIHFPKLQKKKTFLYTSKGVNEKITVLTPNGDKTHSLNNIFFFKDNEEKNDYTSLSVNIQLSRNSRKNDERLFIKVQLVNTSSPFIKNPEDKRYYSTFNEQVNIKSFFGVKISLTNDHLLPYSNYTYSSKEEYFDEDTTTKFIYDQFKDFGVGHGCSIKWDAFNKTVETEYIPSCETPDVDPTPRNKASNAIPEEDKVLFIDPLFLEDTKAQQFKWLSIFSDASDQEVLKGLNDFAESYSVWIQKKREEFNLKKEFSSIASQELSKCQVDYQRIKDNIENLLSGNDNRENLSAFRLMNAVMFMQLWHSIKTKKNEIPGFLEDTSFSTFDLDFYKYKASDKLFSDSDSASWRAFQLAFILLNLDGIFRKKDDSTWEKRNNWVDLIWFPTGGGKTEAYLGLIALTIINRRNVHDVKGGGTAAIMRYTLRLLTMQQFQRATLVIMALELMRRWDKFDLGNEPFTIGLWVGKDSIPNSNDDLIIEFDKKLNQNIENRIPFVKCPWCNSEIKGETKQDDDSTTEVYNKNKVHLKCLNNKCSFSFGIGRVSKKRKDQGPIPVALSDDTIYQHPPTLLFGTVDKFAQLAHKVNNTADGIKADSRRIFGRGNWEPGKPTSGYLPPDLIIQDELHLLLGPLGSAVALFESAVDQLCTRDDGTRPKIISSTATTRNTQLQIAALFDRKVELFPKPGVECDDSFFAYYRRTYKSIDKEDRAFLSKRKYLGVLPTGRTQIWMQMRLASIIMTHRAAYELKQLGDKSPLDFDVYLPFEKAMDYYHTTISYFNSLKEVGKTQSQIQSYILKELRRVFSRVIRPQKLMHSLYTYGPLQESELTGRLSGEEVKNELNKVETKWSARRRFAHLDNGELKKGAIPSEFVVATNMISVGIDVSRFNTIIINSMPRNTAEYIQASSRVGRDSYGLVITVHHPFRARDISHYEKFIEFHEKMYSYVEPISITPFTPKAIDRYMGLYLATMIRHRTGFTARESADMISSISEDDLKKIIESIIQHFEKRKTRLSEFNSQIRNLLKEENMIHIRSWIKEAFDEWKQESNKVLAENKKFVFNNKANKAKPPQEQLYVDIEEYEGKVHSKKWQIPMSLRVIEPEAAIKINSK
jgi:hypothetical protein